MSIGLKKIVAACKFICAALVLSIVGPIATGAETTAFERGWTLQRDGSVLNFQSIKNATKVESSGFAAFSGTISPSGDAKIAILMESVDTKIDLRNVRMRFLLFETFKFPETTITTQLDPALFEDLRNQRRMTIPLPFELNLHGVKKTLEANVVVTLLTDDLVSVATSTPISVATADFALNEGVIKLEEAAGVSIVPSASITFDFLFSRNAISEAVTTEAAAPVEAEAPTSAALETAVFDAKACRGRFDILSRSGNIYFASGSARLDRASEPLLDTLVDVIERCPGMAIEIRGHTDNVGNANYNQRLSESRAGSVAKYIVAAGINSERLQSVGLGESKPAFSNDTAENRRRNRRIEFVVVSE
jgi:OmpA-OmpF porin, OOP family